MKQIPILQGEPPATTQQPQPSSATDPNNPECKDKISNCDDVEDLCNDEDLSETMLEQCPKVINLKDSNI
jgi:hypothetical protein